MLIISFLLGVCAHNSFFWLTSIPCSQILSFISESFNSQSSERVWPILISRSFVNLDVLPDPILRIIIPFGLSFQNYCNSFFFKIKAGKSLIKSCLLLLFSKYVAHKFWIWACLEFGFESANSSLFSSKLFIEEYDREHEDLFSS